MATRRLTRWGLSGLALVLAVIAVMAIDSRHDASAQTKPTLTLSSAQAAGGVDEGQQIVFKVTADQPVSANLRVLGVTQSGGNFIGAEGSKGRRGEIKAGNTTVSFVHTIHDNDLDEVDGYVSFRVNPDPDYELSTSKIKVDVRDNDPAPTAINATLEQKVIARIEDRRDAGDLGTERLWRRALRAIRQTAPMYGQPMTEAEAREHAVTVGNNGHTTSAQTWTEVADEIATPSGTRAVPDEPVITISTKQGFIVEGETATFTLHASKAPDSPVQVNVRVSGVVGWALQSKRTITVSQAGATTFTVPTRVIKTDDIGTMNAVIFAGTGYRVGAPYTSGMPVRNLPDPAVDVNSSGAITEGQDAVFTFTAVPPPDAPMTVNITVEEIGDVTTTDVSSITTVTIPTSGTQTMTFATTDDSNQERIGQIIIHVQPGDGYTQRYGIHSGAGISVLDNDGPAVNVYATQLSVTEGEEAVFALTTTPISNLVLDVKVRITQVGSYASASLPQQRNVVIQPGGSNPAVKVATVNDSVEQDDGSITVTIQTTYTGYVIGTSSATITVLDDDGSSPQDQNDQQQVEPNDDGNFTPNQALVDTVQQKADNHSSSSASARLQKIVNGMTGKAGGYTSQECRDTAAYHGVSNAWKPWCDEIDRRENAASTNTPPPPPPPDPEISISAGSGVTEGANAQFTLTATPAPSSPLNVTVDVTQSGDFATTGSQTVTIPATGSATLTIATTDDSTDEPDGSVTATLQAGSGYTLGSASAASVAVSDNDDPAPNVFVPNQALVDLVQDKADKHPNPDAQERLQKIVDGMLGKSGGYDSAKCRQVAQSYNVASVWKPWCDEIERRENSVSNPPPPPPPPPPPDPAISIVGGPSVTEGGNVVFTLTATPSPTSPLTVSVNLTQSGDFASVGARTVVINGATATLSVATVDDSTDEPNGSVTATLQAGSGYTLSATSSATVAVSDDDDAAPPPPVVPVLTIAKGADVTEGGDAVFTISADQAPTAPLAVSINVTQSGDFASVGTRTVTLSGTSATLTIATVNDAVDEANGSVTATLQTGGGYTLGSSSAATVNVADDDDPPPPPPPPPPPETAGSLDCDNSGVIVDEFTVTERYNGFAFFKVLITLCEPYYGPKYFDYSIEHITTDSADLLGAGGTLVLGSFEQSKHINVVVMSDGKAEGDETFALVLSRPDPSHIDLGHGRVLGTITDP